MEIFEATMRPHEVIMDVLRSRLDRNGIIVFGPEDEFFSDEEWRLLEYHGLERNLPYETVLIGDAGEPNRVEVGRLMTDVDRPRVVNEKWAHPMIAVLAESSRIAFYQALLGIPRLYMRRAQINRMHPGSFIGRHVDMDSNPDYAVAIVLQFGQKFDGGDFIIHHPRKREPLSITPKYRMVTITRCDFPHEVEEVTRGVRTTLVYFVSGHALENRRYMKQGADAAASGAVS